MAFEDIKDHAEDLKHETKNLIDSGVRYIKLLGFKIAVKSTGAVIKYVLLALLLFFVISFLSMAAAFGLGYWLNNWAYGFGIIGLIYLILALFVMYRFDKITEKPLLTAFSKKFFKEEE